MSLIERYEARLAAEDLSSDPEQLRALEALQRIADELAEPVASGWRSWFQRTTPAVQGLYLWGGVGRGKTWLMDLFHDNLQGVSKARFHFHRFMQLVHSELTAVKGKALPITVHEIVRADQEMTMVGGFAARPQHPESRLGLLHKGRRLIVDARLPLDRRGGPADQSTLPTYDQPNRPLTQRCPCVTSWSACVYCGNCIGVCPTNALQFKTEFDLRTAGEWRPEEQTVTTTVCSYCGVGCNLELHVQDNEIVKVTSPADPWKEDGGRPCCSSNAGFSATGSAEWSGRSSPSPASRRTSSSALAAASSPAAAVRSGRSESGWSCAWRRGEVRRLLIAAERTSPHRDGVYLTRIV